VPRQNGKGGIIEARVMAGLFVFGEKLIVWTAHEYKTAQEGFLRIRELIRSVPDYHKLVKRYWEGSGEQGIELVTGQRLRFLARSKGSGRGFSGDTVILDEAQALTLEQMKALFSTLSAKPNPQIWYFGTPPDDPTAWIYGVKEDGESGKPAWRTSTGASTPRLSCHSDEGRALLADRRPVVSGEPGAGHPADGDVLRGRAVATEGRLRLREAGHLAPEGNRRRRVISEELWRELADAESERPTDVAFAIEVNMARTHGAIVAVGPRSDGQMVASVVDYRPGTTGSPSVPRTEEAVGSGGDRAGRERSGRVTLLLDLERAGITVPADEDHPDRGDLAVPNAQAAATGYGLLIDLIREKGFVHLDEAPLNLAVAQAQTRALSGGTTWERKGMVDISTLGAATVAHWAYVTRIELVGGSEPSVLFL
jgi:hypothetical protein